MKRKTWKRWLALLAATGCTLGAAAFATACKDKGEGVQSSSVAEATLTDFENETVEVGYGNTFTLQRTAVDSNGESHVVTATVSTKSGGSVEVLNGKFVASEKEGYTVTYTCMFGGETLTRTVTVNVVASNKPIIEINGAVTAVVCGRNYLVPTCTATDYFDGALSATTEVYKKGAEQDEKVEYDAEHGVYTTTAAGEYYVLYTAANSSGIKEEKKLPFYVRESAKAGEWDSFDDIGCQYTVEARKGVKGLEYLPEFEGREGVLRASLDGSVNQYTQFWAIEPKSLNLEDYQDYAYVAVSAYLEGSAADILNVRLMADCPMNELKSGEWVTMYFSAASWLKESRWNAAFGAEATEDGKKELRGNGSVFGDVHIYFDSIYFVNEVADLECTFQESEEGITPAFTGSKAPNGYKVTYNGREIPVREGKFQADYVGDYIVEPLYCNDDGISFKRFTYQSTGAHEVRLNAYDESISGTATTFVAPEATVVDGLGAEVEGYTVKTSIVYKDTLGVEKKVLSVTPANKGWYTYTFTAEKAEHKSLEKSVTVKVGDFLKGEILNAADSNSAQRFAGMFTGGNFQRIELSAAANETEGLPADLVGKTFVKLAYNNNVTTTYLNFNSVMTEKEAESGVSSLVTMSVYVKGTFEGTAPTIKANFLGESTNLQLNAWNKLQCSRDNFLEKYKKLATHATWADYALAIEATGVTGAEFKALGLTLYVEKVTLDEQAVIYNPDMSRKELSSSAEELNGFTGDYTGNVTKLAVANNQNYRFANVYTKEQLETLAETYNTASLYLAVDGIPETPLETSPDVTPSVSMMKLKDNAGDTFVYKAAGNQTTKLYAADNKTWKKFSISMQDYIALLEVNEYAYCNLLRSYPEGISLKATPMSYYFSNIEFSYVEPSTNEPEQDQTEPCIVKVDETSHLNIENTDVARGYVAAGSTEIADFAGDYTGNAKKLKHARGNENYYFVNPYTVTQLNDYAETYHYVKMWIAFSEIPVGERGYFNSTKGFVGKSDWAGESNKTIVPTDEADTATEVKHKTWYQISITIADYIALVEGATENKIQIFVPYSKLSDNSAKNFTSDVYMYIGDITLEK